MVRNQWLFFPQFCAFLTNCIKQSAHNFEAVFLIDRTTLWQEILVHHSIEHNLHIWPNLTCYSGGFDWDDWALVPMSGHTPMFRHQLWPFWANLDRRWTSPTSSERCPCDIVFAQNLAILEEPSLPHVSYLKYPSNCLAWAERYVNIISNFSNNDSMIIKIIFFTALICSSVFDVLGRPGLLHLHWNIFNLS